jgi:DHA1 family multidrug resistance protein-like MFS transporter
MVPKTLMYVHSCTFLSAGINETQNPRNWSQTKKFFVTFEICFLTFSVYIGSAIFTAGIEDVMHEFGVSQVAAILGLTLYDQSSRSLLHRH